MFFTLVEGQIRLVNHLSAVMSPFGASSEAGMLLAMPPNHPSLSEAVAQWLSVHHVCLFVLFAFVETLITSYETVNLTISIDG